jgi:hypothetical protein
VRGWGNTTDRIMLLLQDHELTKIEICTKLGLTHDDVASVLTRLRRASKKFGKRIYIYDWQREAIGKRYYLRAIFKAGSSADKPKPPALTPRERSQRSHKKKMLIKRSQIFRGQYGIRP